MSDPISIDGIEVAPGNRLLFTGQPRRRWWQRLLRRKPPRPSQHGVYVVGREEER